MKNPNKEGAHSLIGFIAFCQSRSSLVLQTKRGILRHPASVLAPGSALGALPSVALSSVQAGPIIVEHEGMCRKIAHAIHRADVRSWPITDRGEHFSLADPMQCELHNRKHTCLTHRQRSKNLRPPRRS